MSSWPKWLQASGSGKSEDGQATTAENFWVYFLLLLILAGVSIWVSAPNKQAVFTEYMVALAAIGAGGGLGFLFGMPRSSEATDSADAKARTDGASASSRGSRPNTNLEQISDWLTKILIGAGLVELGRMGPELASMGRNISKLTPHEPSGVFAQLIIVFFAIMGFVLGYVWTRIYYTGMQARFDRNLENELNQVRTERDQARQDEQKAMDVLKETIPVPDKPASDEPDGPDKPNGPDGLNNVGEDAETPEGNGEDTASQNDYQGLSQQQADASGLTERQPKKLTGFAGFSLLRSKIPADLRDRIIAFVDAEISFSTDPSRALFMGAQKAIGDYKLSVQIQQELKGNLVLRAEVTTGNLKEPQVYFLLHPTYNTQSILLGKPIKRNVFQLDFAAGGCFTLVAILFAKDEPDKPVVLSSNLRYLEGVPDWFKVS